MRYTTAALLGLLAVQQAAACDICEWGQALGLPSCQNSCNQCTQQQQQGLDFSQCPAGSSSFGGLNFGGCSIGSWLGLKKKSFIPRGGKRSLGNADALFDTEEHEFYKRNDQCALGALTSGGGPSFSCGAGTNAFSISNMLVSCDHDTPAQLTYSYDSGPQAGQTCQQQVQLSAGAPQTITNTQCGGASSVQCALGANAPVPSCNLGIHSVNFDCSGCGGGSGGGSPPTPAAPPPAAASTAPPAAPPPPAAPSVPAAPPPPPPAAPSVPAAPPPPPPANTPPAAPPPPAVTPPVVPPPANTPPAVPPPAVTPPVVPPPGVSTVPGVPPPFSPSTSLSTSISVSVSTSPSTPTYPANGSTVIIQTTQPLITTEVVYTTLTSCNGYNTVTHGNYTSIQTVQTLSTLLLTSTQTVCTKCTAPPETVSPASTISTTVSISNSVQSVVVTQSVATSVQAAPAPSLLPSCLQTWIKLTGCKDNSDSNCFCNDANFTKNVQECVSAWSNHKDQEAQALSYLAGICAPHIGNNPGIITNIPSTITLQPTPAPTNTGNGAPAAPGGQTAGAGQPVTTISLSTTVTVQCSAGGSSMAGGCSSTSVLNTQVAVPQVAFTTAQPGKVGLVAGTPAPAPAVATPAPAAASPNSPASPANTPPAPAAPAGTGAITPYYSPSATVQPFTGAATNLGGSSLLVSVVVAVAGLFVL